MIKMKTYLKKQWNYIKNSVQLHNFHYVLLVDLVYYVLLLLSLIFIGQFKVAPKLQMLINLVTFRAEAPSIAETNAMFSEASRGFFFWFILLIIVIATLYAFTKGLIWLLIEKKKLNGFKNLYKLLLFRVITYLIFGLLFYLSYYALQPSVFALYLLFIQIPLFIHLANIFHPYVISKGYAWKNVMKGLGLVFRLPLYIVPYLVIFVVGFLLLLILGFFVFLTEYISGRILGLFAFLLVIVYLNWSKYYLYQIIKPFCR